MSNISLSDTHSTLKDVPKINKTKVKKTKVPYFGHVFLPMFKQDCTPKKGKKSLQLSPPSVPLKSKKTRRKSEYQEISIGGFYKKQRKPTIETPQLLPIVPNQNERRRKTTLYKEISIGGFYRQQPSPECATNIHTKKVPPKQEKRKRKHSHQEITIGGFVKKKSLTNQPFSSNNLPKDTEHQMKKARSRGMQIYDIAARIYDYCTMLWID